MLNRDHGLTEELGPNPGKWEVRASQAQNHTPINMAKALRWHKEYGGPGMSGSGVNKARPLACTVQ